MTEIPARQRHDGGERDERAERERIRRSAVSAMSPASPGTSPKVTRVIRQRRGEARQEAGQADGAQGGLAGPDNARLGQECRRLHRRLTPFRRLQLRLRGRLAQSMAEHEAVVAALDRGDGGAASDAIRSHVAVQGEKFHNLMASLRAVAE